MTQKTSKVSNNKMTVGFKPLCGLFSQFKYIPLKYAPITLELELVNSMTEPIIIQLELELMPATFLMEQ